MIGLGRLLPLWCVSLATCALAAPPQTKPGAVDPDAQRLALERIERASTPSAAAEAYRAAVAEDPDNIALRHALVQRMVGLGKPQLAETQALELNQLDPHDGLAWGVLAFTRASTGDTTEGLRDIVSAAQYAPNDPFIGRTAGRLLAWFDTEADWRLVPPYLMHALDAAREQLRNTEPFATTYWIGRRSYEFRNNQGLPNVATPFYPPPYALAVPEPSRRDVAPGLRTGRLARRGRLAARGGLAQNGRPALPPPLPQQPFPPGSPPRPRIKQPIVPPSVPLTPAPAYTQNELPPRVP